MSWGSLKHLSDRIAKTFPCLLPLIGCVAGLLLSSANCWVLIVAIASLGLFWGVWNRSVFVVAGVGAMLSFGWLHEKRCQQQEQAELQLLQERDLALSLLVEQRPGTRLIPAVGRLPSGARVVLEGLPDGVNSGDELMIRGFAKDVRMARNPGVGSWSEMLRERGYAGVIVVREIERIGKGSFLVQLRGEAEKLAGFLGKRVTEGIENPKSAALVKAAVLGEKEGGRAVFEGFRRTGTMHVFTVSGLHVGLVGLIAWGVGLVLRWPPRVTVWFVLVSILGYAVITGLRPAALRATLMAWFCLSGPLLGRRSAVLNNLLLAALVVLAFDSFQLWQAGFQLSFVVVLFILGLEPGFWRRILPLIREDSYLPKVLWSKRQKVGFWLRSQVGRLVSVSSAAWCGSSPLSIVHFGWFSPIGIFASVLMIPMAFLILSNAIASAFIGSVLPLWSKEINRWNGGIAYAASAVANRLESLPGAWSQFHSRAPWQDGLILFDLPHGARAMHLDVGGGILVNGGRRSDYFETVQRSLRTYGLSFDSLIATNASSTHLQGLFPALERESVHQVLVPLSHEPLFREFADEALTLGRQVNDVFTERYSLDHGIDIEVLWPSSTAGRNDDEAMVFRLLWKGWKILYTDNSGSFIEQQLLLSAKDVSADVWVCGVNRADWVGSEPFRREVGARVVLVLDERFPEEFQVSEDWCRSFIDEGSRVIRQSEVGALMLRPTESKLEIESYLVGLLEELTVDKRESQ